MTLDIVTCKHITMLLSESIRARSVKVSNERLFSVYDLINQTSLYLQYTNESWLWKLEAMMREAQGNTFAALSAGFDYTFYQIDGQTTDLGWLL